MRQTCKPVRNGSRWSETLASRSITPKAPADLHLRWADKEDLFAINALEGFVKETDFMESELPKGDRCLLLEKEEKILAFAWVTFRDFKLAL